MRKERDQNNWRFYFLFFLFFLGFSALLARLVFLQVFKFSQYSALAQSQHNMQKELLPERGRIFVGGKDGEYFPAAANKKTYSLYIVPREIENREDFISAISRVISEEKKRDREELEKAMERIVIELNDSEKSIISEDNKGGENILNNPFSELISENIDEDLRWAAELLEERLRDINDPYEFIMSDLSAETAEEIKNAKLKGAYFSEGSKRYYPEQEFAADILGFVGFYNEERAGRYGLEEFFNLELEGKSGLISGEKDSSGRWMAIEGMNINPARNGSDIYLTIDRNIQFKAEEELKNAIREYQADSGSVVVIDPQTGAVMALADWPTFNPNFYNKFSDFDRFQNGAVQKIYEPGSVFKVITMSAALEEGKILPLSKYNDKGYVVVKDRILNNVDRKFYGSQTMTEVLEKSLNTGAVYALQAAGEEKFLKYVKDYGFGNSSGIELAGEISGSLKTLEEIPLNSVNYATASFGQGISVTPLGMAAAISVIANGGILMKPYLAAKISSDGREFSTSPSEAGRVISPQTAARISAMMASVVKNGSGSLAGVSGYNVAGKTGTAQVPEAGGYSDKAIHSFVGFAPLENPKFAMLVKLDNPKVRFSSSTAAPTFGKIAKFILEYYSIPPNT